METLEMLLWGFYSTVTTSLFFFFSAQQFDLGFESWLSTSSGCDFELPIMLVGGSSPGFGRGPEVAKYWNKILVQGFELLL